MTWATKTLCDVNRAIRRLTRLYDFYLDDHDKICAEHILVCWAKKKSSRKPLVTMCYAIEVPRNVEHAFKLDEEMSLKLGKKVTYWQDAIAKEIKALTDLEVFEFKDNDFKNPQPLLDAGYQQTNIHMVFDVKHDLRRKVRLVAGGHLVKVLDNLVYSSMVKTISIRLLHVIADKAKMSQLCGDIGNAFPHATTNENFFFKAGL